MSNAEILYGLCRGCSRMKRIDSECEACTKKNQRLLFLRSSSIRIDQIAREIYVRTVSTLPQSQIGLDSIARGSIDMAIAYVDEFEKFRTQETL
jgi:hypothetical protein